MKKLHIKVCFVLVLSVLCFMVMEPSSALDYFKDKDYIYLSDISYDKELSFVEDGESIYLDRNKNSNLITLLVDGSSRYFGKGISAWASSSLVYDISDYSSSFDYFAAYVGIDSSQMSTYYNNGASITIYTSFDGVEYEEFDVDGLSSISAYDDAIYVKIPLEGVNYLKFDADKIGTHWYAQWYDEVVYANAKLMKDGYVDEYSYVDDVKTVSEYDALIKGYSTSDISNEDYRVLLLKRELVNNTGYENLQAIMLSDEVYMSSILSLFNDYELLRDFTMGGTPDGNYTNALKVWSSLYYEFKDDLSVSGLTEYGVLYSELYKNMLISLSLTHSTTVGFWGGGVTGNVDNPNDSSARERYLIYKNLHSAGLLDNYIFELLEVEEMRFVMNNIVDDESIEWFNAFIRKNDGNRNPYQYITYRFGYEYSDTQYYSDENYDMWDQKYNLSFYNITYEMGYPKPWIIMEEGGVCGAISKTGSNIFGSFGVPSSVIGQPGHAAYIVYSLNSDGDAVYTIWNNISGWGYSGKTEKLSVRMPNGWGTGAYALSYPASYILLAQGALNDFDSYEEAEMILLQSKVYDGDLIVQESICREAISINNINLDAWYGLVLLYSNDDSKSDKDIYDLIVQISKALAYYPMPMYDMLRLLLLELESTEYIFKYNLLLEEVLTNASSATSSESIQDLAVREVANLLLGAVDTSVATFSFDGDLAGKIVLSDKFVGSSVRWEYSLDGGDSYTATNDEFVLLSNGELESINVDDDIIIHIVGQDYSVDNLFVIDIVVGSEPSNIYNNDLENRVIGVNNLMQWRMPIDDEWTNFSDANPELDGDTIVYVRVAPTGQSVASGYSEMVFTEDTDTSERKYVSIDSLSIFDYSSDQVSSDAGVDNIIDGNIYTIWHSLYDGSDTDRFVTIKLDKAIYLSALEYVPRQGGSNGIIKDGLVYGSLDGTNYELLYTIEDWAYSYSTKNIEFDDSVYVQYIKVVCTSNYGDGRSFVSGNMINVFEDTTKLVIPTADVIYDISVATKNDVVVSLTNFSEEVVILNNGGSDTYTFKDNGTFTFEFESLSGAKGSAVAKVDWIDKVKPTVVVEYSDKNATNLSVLVTLKNYSEDIVILNNNGSNEYVFEENGEFIFDIRDMVGNTNSISVKVDNIDRILPSANVSYSTNDVTTGVVVATLDNISENITVLNNNGSFSYSFTNNGTFVFQIADDAGNTNYVEANVDWIVDELVDEDVDTNLDGNFSVGGESSGNNGSNSNANDSESSTEGELDDDSDEDDELTEQELEIKKAQDDARSNNMRLYCIAVMISTLFVVGGAIIHEKVSNIRYYKNKSK